MKEFTKELAERISENLEVIFGDVDFLKRLADNDGIILAKDKEKLSKEIVKGIQSSMLPSIANDMIVEIYLEDNSDTPETKQEQHLVVILKRADTDDILFELKGTNVENLIDEMRGKLW